MKVALIHDHLAQDGGAEKVLKALTELFPDAPIFTLLYDEKNANQHFKTKRIFTSVIQRLPGGIKYYKWYMPFMPMAVEFFDLSEYDLIISDASAFAKGVITNSDALHICYCHTPTRYLWSDTHSYIKELNYNKYLKKVIAFVLNYIRVWDKAAADRVDLFVANSHFVAKRIQKYYRRDSKVIYPPVELESFYPSDTLDNYFLVGGRLVPYKRFDVVIEAFKKLDLPLKVFGDGVDLKRLKEIAGEHSKIEFLGRVSDQERARLYSKCQAFINPQEEDFGITVVEAMASGRPVIALEVGGAKETIIPEKTGLFFKEQNAEALIAAVQSFQTKCFNPEEIREHALQFSTQRFKREIKEFVEQEYQKL